MKEYETIKYCLDKASISTNLYEEFLYLAITNSLLQETSTIVAEEKSKERTRRREIEKKDFEEFLRKITNA